jgi:NAD-dependent dihydropyrimidine dehydrogenase PreA subunit
MIREIVEVDEALCDGCGDCVPSCAEGALQVVDGKVRLVGDVLCDGLGACLGECPKGALKVARRDVAPFDEHAVSVHLRSVRSGGAPPPGERHGTGRPAGAPPPRGAPVPSAPSLAGALPAGPGGPAAAAGPAARRPSLSVMQAPAEAAGGGCPGSRGREIARPSPRAPAAGDGAATPSALAHWPVQIELVSPRAPWLAGADLLVAADCVPFAYADFHRDYLAGRKVLVGCPKLDDVSGWVERLAEVIREGAPRSVTVVKMEVPCCGGIARAVREAVAASGRAVPLAESTVSVDGRRLA